MSYQIWWDSPKMLWWGLIFIMAPDSNRYNYGGKGILAPMTVTTERRDITEKRSNLETFSAWHDCIAACLPSLLKHRLRKDQPWSLLIEKHTYLSSQLEKKPLSKFSCTYFVILWLYRIESWHSKIPSACPLLDLAHLSFISSLTSMRTLGSVMREAGF